MDNFGTPLDKLATHFIERLDFENIKFNRSNRKNFRTQPEESIHHDSAMDHFPFTKESRSETYA